MSPRKVTKVDVSCMDIQLTQPFSISSAAPALAKNVLVRIHLEDGSIGYGEAAPFEEVSGETQAATVAAILLMTGSLIGEDAAQWREISDLLKEKIPANPAARCAIEQALLDSLARHLKLSLTHFFGGAKGELITDITIPASDVEHARVSARRAIDAGFGTVKIKVGGAAWGYDVERICAVVSEAPQLKVIADANEAFSVSEARRFVTSLRHRGIELALFEQPTSAERLDDLVAVERDCGVRVCADESVRSAIDAAQLVRAGCVSIVNVKLMKHGVVDALDVISVARAAGMKCMIGGMIESKVSMSFSAALAMANHGSFPFVDLDTPLFMDRLLVEGGITYVGETVTIPVDAFGSGIDASHLFTAY